MKNKVYKHTADKNNEATKKGNSLFQAKSILPVNNGINFIIQKKAGLELSRRENNSGLLVNPGTERVIQRSVAVQTPAKDLFGQCYARSTILKALVDRLHDIDPVVVVNFSESISGVAMFSHNDEGTPGGTVWIKTPSTELNQQLITNYTIELVHEFQHALDYVLKPDFRKNHVLEANYATTHPDKIAVSKANRIKSEWNAFAVQAAETLHQKEQSMTRDESELIGCFSSERNFMTPNSKMFEVTKSYCLRYSLIDSTVHDTVINAFVTSFMETNAEALRGAIELFQEKSTK